MTSETPAPGAPPRQSPRWVGPVVFVLAMGLVALAGLLAVSINERRWESLRPTLALKPVGEWETDSAVWGQNYPREYETYLATRIDTTRTKFGGAFPRDYLDEDPNLVILFSGYGFSKDYRQARGHAYAIADVTNTKRVAAATPATCWTCKSPDVPRLMAKAGVKEFYATRFADLKAEITHPIGCPDCHDPKTMNLRITRPALGEALAAQGRPIGEATHQEMRSLVCAQCHVEYYFKDKTYLAFPWAKGTTVEDMLAYYDATNFSDYTHAVSGTPILKAQHPDYELYQTGVHAYRGVSCADCHMPYRTEGGVKFTNHHVASPLLDIATSCSVCHRWGEEEIRGRVETIQTKVQGAKLAAEKALVQAHFDVAASAQAGATDADLAPLRARLRHAQFRWDFVAASNGMGFHSPQEAMRLLGDAAGGAQEVRVMAARLLARQRISAEPKYPDVSTREKAAAVSAAFGAGSPPRLLP
jgi:nitrite reductase (cytochrome c-552)